MLLEIKGPGPPPPPLPLHGAFWNSWFQDLELLVPWIWARP